MNSQINFNAAAVRKNRLFGQVTKQRVGLVTRDCFKYARDREGGKRGDKIHATILVSYPWNNVDLSSICVLLCFVTHITWVVL